MVRVYPEYRLVLPHNVYVLEDQVIRRMGYPPEPTRLWRRRLPPVFFNPLYVEGTALRAVGSNAQGHQTNTDSFCGQWLGSYRQSLLFERSQRKTHLEAQNDQLLAPPMCLLCQISFVDFRSPSSLASKGIKSIIWSLQARKGR